MNQTNDQKISTPVMLLVFMVAFLPLAFLLVPSEQQMWLHYQVVALSEWWLAHPYLNGIVCINGLISLAGMVYLMKKESPEPFYYSYIGMYCLVSMNLFGMVIIYYIADFIFS